MEVYIPTGIGTVPLYTLSGRYISILELSHETQLTCEGQTVLVTEPESIRTDLSASTILTVVRFEGDVEEDGYYIEAKLLGL